MNPASSIAPQSTMQAVLEAYPGARRALFRRYHIGGCSSCGFQPEETLQQVCTRNQIANVDEVLAHIQTSHEQDEKILIAPSDLKVWREKEPELKLVDIRAREEFEAVHIAGSILLSQELMQEMLSRWPREQPFVIVDHEGKQSLDAAAYFLGHGFTNVRSLRGGIDAWAREADPKMKRYRLASP